MPGDDYSTWDRGNIRGIGSTQYVGKERDAYGNEHRVFEINDTEWGPQQSDLEKYQFEYMAWHRKNHVGVRDSRCTICTAEQQFAQQQLPHIQNHRRLKQYDPSCRFCQDDRFFGRM